MLVEARTGTGDGERRMRRTQETRRKWPGFPMFSRAASRAADESQSRDPIHGRPHSGPTRRTDTGIKMKRKDGRNCLGRRGRRQSYDLSYELLVKVGGLSRR